MNDLRKAAEMALDVLNHSLGHSNEAQEQIDKTKQALRQALAQPKQEPVAWMDKVGAVIPHTWKMYQPETYERCTTPLYTAPPSIETAVLAEREACAKVCDELGEKGYVAEGCAKAIRARGEK